MKNADPLFGYNILGRRDAEAFDKEVHEMMIYAHQLVCYQQLFDLFYNIGAITIPDWRIPRPILHQDVYQNNVPVLNTEIIDQFKMWLEELPKVDAEAIVNILTTELIRLGIITDNKYETGFNADNTAGDELTIKLFRFQGVGKKLTIYQSELPVSINHAHELIRQRKSPINDKTIPRLRETIAAVDIRTAVLKEALDNATLDTKSMASFIEKETQIQTAKILDKNLMEANKKLAHLGSETIKNVETVTKSVGEQYASDVNSIEVSLNQTKAQIGQILKNIEEETKTRIESVASGFKTEGVLKSAFDLWDDKEKRHRKAFNIGIGIYVGLIILIAVLTAIYNGPIFEFLGNIFSVAKDNLTQAFSHLILITLPLGVVVWVLRTVLRWANLNLALAEDAAQRSVMAQTYVNLLTNGDVTEDKDDRKVMLEAIFRALPGIQEMDTAPPSIINFANPGTGK